VFFIASVYQPPLTERRIPANRSLANRFARNRPGLHADIPLQHAKLTLSDILTARLHAHKLFRRTPSFAESFVESNSVLLLASANVGRSNFTIGFCSRPIFGSGNAKFLPAVRCSVRKSLPHQHQRSEGGGSRLDVRALRRFIFRTDNERAASVPSPMPTPRRISAGSTAS
jgi:hypothetical protein